MTRRPILLHFAVGLIAAGCTLGPDYKRPPVSVPPAYRGESAPAADARSFGDLRWWEVFHDEELQALIRQAIQNNYDLRIAAARVLEARAQVGVARSFLFPQVGGRASAGRVGVSGNQLLAPPAGTDREGGDFLLGADLSWELDFWGKFRRGTEAARAQLLATEEARWTILQSLVTDVAGAYFDLRGLDDALEVAKRTVASREKSLQLVRARRAGGVASGIDLRQAESLLAGAKATIPDIERQIEQVENRITLLLGENPGAIRRGRSLTQQAILPTIPAGLTSTLIERRPDIRLAEQQLVAANADIGVAKSLFFPQIVLTGNGGWQSANLSKLFDGPSGWYSIAAALLAPIFTGGRLTSNLEGVEARHQELVLTYQQTILQGFREVSDGLVGYRKARERREEEDRLVRAVTEYANLSQVRYKGGVTSYLEVLDAERERFEAELELVAAQRGELLAFVQVYKALGGGWQQEPGPTR
jgi:multidrug efflux system outer membrane protein